jgi:hypothetical protein
MLGLLFGAIGLLVAGAPTPAAAQPPAGARADIVDPAAVAAFERMSSYLAGLKTFEIKATYSFDILARNHQTITIDGAGRYLAKRPDRLFADVENDLFGRQYIYDGKTLTVVSKGEKYFAQVAVPATIRETLAEAAAKFAIEIPMADLFDLGTPHSPIHRLQSAFSAGRSEVDGVEADHWAFRTADRDWQVWIRTGDRPVPLKFTLVDRAQPTHPRYSVTLSWIERADIPDSDFTFVPSAEQRRIEIMRIGAAEKGK